jgi:tRNA A37 threonylcarbamoyladenosine synthetase subunit TsaC/SUA5/YrdC
MNKINETKKRAIDNNLTAIINNIDSREGIVKTPANH